MSDEMNEVPGSTPISSTPIQSTTPGFLDGNPRTMFTFGLVSGMAMILLMNNFSAFSSGNAVAAAAPSVAAATAPAAAAAAPAGKLDPVTDKDHVRGDLKKAKVVLVEYSDFQCPYCGKHDPTMQQIVKDYGDQVAWVYRHFPLSFHPNAVPVALASECASEQGKFWEFADAMYAGQTENLSGDAATATAFVNKTASDLKLDTKKFNDCVSSAKYQSVVDADSASGRTAGVNGTPATYVNGTLVSGAVPYASMKKMIDDAIAKAK